jgi:hypothetical protein
MLHFQVCGTLYAPFFYPDMHKMEKQMIMSTGTGSKVQGGAPLWDFTIIRVFVFSNL